MLKNKEISDAQERASNQQKLEQLLHNKQAIQKQIDDVQKSCNDYENLLKRGPAMEAEFPNVPVDSRAFTQDLMYKRQLLTYSNLTCTELSEMRHISQ